MSGLEKELEALRSKTKTLLGETLLGEDLAVAEDAAKELCRCFREQLGVKSIEYVGALDLLSKAWLLPNTATSRNTPAPSFRQGWRMKHIQRSTATDFFPQRV